MFTKKEYEHCTIYYNMYEDIDIIQGITDWISVDIYVSGQHTYECLSLTDAVNHLHDIGVEFKVAGE